MEELKTQEVQAAITYFEDAVKESDEIIGDCTPALQAELTEQKQHFVVALDALRRAAPENKALTVTLPCKVGDTVFANIDDHKEDYLDECIISRIEFTKDYTEPLFTAICYAKAEYQTYWQSDFGKIIFLEPYSRRPEAPK